MTGVIWAKIGDGTQGQGLGARITDRAPWTLGLQCWVGKFIGVEFCF